MNLDQAVTYSELKTPVRQIQPKTRSAKDVAKRVFQLAANGGFPYKNSTPEGWARKWLSSSEFTLMEIDIHAAANLNINAVASPHPPKNPNRVQHYVNCSVDALDPIVVDLNKRGVGKAYLGYAPEVIVLDGKHRKMAQVQNGRMKILAWVGCKAQKRLEKLKKVTRVVDAATENIFLPPVEPTKIAKAYELYASTIPAIAAGGPGSGRHEGQGKDTRGFEPSRPAFKSYPHFDYDQKTGFKCKHCKENSFTNVDDMYQHLQGKHKTTIDAMGGSLGEGSGSNPLIMKTNAIKTELKRLTAAHSIEASSVARVKALTKELRCRMDVNACGARSSGSLSETSSSDSKVPHDASDAGESVEPSDQLEWEKKPQVFAPGTGPGYVDQFGSPNLQSPGSGVGPRVLNKGASRSENRRIEAKGKKLKSDKRVDKIYEEASSECNACGEVAAVAPPGREDQVKKLKSKFGKKAAFKIAWSRENRAKK